VYNRTCYIYFQFVLMQLAVVCVVSVPVTTASIDYCTHTHSECVVHVYSYCCGECTPGGMSTNVAVHYMPTRQRCVLMRCMHAPTTSLQHNHRICMYGTIMPTLCMLTDSMYPLLCIVLINENLQSDVSTKCAEAARYH
jgi:hypothetical protein